MIQSWWSTMAEMLKDTLNLPWPAPSLTLEAQVRHRSLLLFPSSKLGFSMKVKSHVTESLFALISNYLGSFFGHLESESLTSTVHHGAPWLDTKRSNPLWRPQLRPTAFNNFLSIIQYHFQYLHCYFISSKDNFDQFIL